MEITIKGLEKEIAALVVELQKQQREAITLDERKVAECVIKNGELIKFCSIACEEPIKEKEKPREGDSAFVAIQAHSPSKNY